MCCIIKGFADAMFVVRIFSGGIKAAAYGQKTDKIWMKAVAFEKKGIKFGFFCRAILNAAI